MRLFKKTFTLKVTRADHYYASGLGIRPTAFGGMKLNIFPLPGELDYAEGIMAHPQGNVYVWLQRFTDHLELKYRVPASLSLTVNAQVVDTPEGIIRFPVCSDDDIAPQANTMTEKPADACAKDSSRIDIIL